MATLKLQGNLGERHKQFNLEVEKAVNNSTSFEDIKKSSLKSDINALFAIEIANKYKNVDYILEALQSEDILYATRAIKRSSWLINDVRYYHLINPHYLHTKLFPHMTYRAITKFLSHLKLKLEDEMRVDEFFRYYEEIDIKVALKWLPRCSVSVIEDTVENHSSKINIKLFRRLCNKSFTVVEKYYGESCTKARYLKCVAHFINDPNYSERYVTVAERLFFIYDYNYVKFNKKDTAGILKYCPHKIFDNFDKYANIIHLETLSKHIGPDKIKEFVQSEISKNFSRKWLNYKNIIGLTKCLTKMDKFYFIQSLLKNKAYVPDEGDEENDNNKCYKHATFDVAYCHLIKKVKAEPVAAKRLSTLEILLMAAGRDGNNISKILQYYTQNHMDDDLEHRMSFVDSLLLTTDAYNFDENNWNMLNRLFKSIEVYNEKINTADHYIHVIIVYKIIHQQPIPDVIMKNDYTFNTLKQFRARLSTAVADLVFEFLFNLLKDKIIAQIDTNESTYIIRGLLLNMCDLLSDWNKDLKQYFEILKITFAKKWDLLEELQKMYNMNKSWRKYKIHEESLLFESTENALFNILKHNPDMLQKFTNIIDAMRSNGKVRLSRVHSKLRIYWSDSIRTEWEKFYISMLNAAPDKCCNVARSFCEIATKDTVIELIAKFDQNKIEHSSQELAKVMYYARPQPSLETVLEYTKELSLHEMLPSVNAILYNMPANRYRECITTLLGDNKYSYLQRYSIRYAYQKLSIDEIRKLVPLLWDDVKYSTVRTVIFHETFKLLTRQKDPMKVTKTWNLLENFIDSLTHRECKSLCNIMCRVNKLPCSVQAKYCMKTHNYLKTLPPTKEHTKICQNISIHCKNLMDTIDSKFVEDIILDFIDEWLVREMKVSDFGYPNLMLEVVAAYVLCTSDETVQVQRYETVVRPILHHCFKKPSPNVDGCDSTSYFENLKWKFILLERKNLVRNIYISPVKVFTMLLSDAETHLDYVNNYSFLTVIKLALMFVECGAVIQSELPEPVDVDSKEFYIKDKITGERFRKMWLKITPLFADACIKVARDDMNKYYPNILKQFNTTLEVFCTILTARSRVQDMELVDALLRDPNNKLGYLIAVSILPYEEYTQEKIKRLKELQNRFKTHWSVEVQASFYNRFPEQDPLNMPPLQLEGATLGQKHRSFNTQVIEALQNETPLESVGSEYGESVVGQLLKIEVANRRRDVEYVLQTLKSADMVVVSRAIRGGGWLVLDDQYSHIVEPHFLHDQLLPHMTTRAACKLILHVRLTLRDEHRVDQFFKYYESKGHVAKALKWLPNCSKDIIEKAVELHSHKLSVKMFRRLCERSETAFDKFNLVSYLKNPYYKSLTRLLRNPSFAKKYLLEVKTTTKFYEFKINRKQTKIIMKQCPDVIFDDLRTYLNHIDLEAVGRYLGADKIKDFLLETAQVSGLYNWFTFDNVKHLLKLMPYEGRYEFLKTYFISPVVEDTNDDNHTTSLDNNLKVYALQSRTRASWSKHIYQWYRFVPFENTFEVMKKLVELENIYSERKAILEEMILTTRDNLDDLDKVIEYYHSKHRTETVQSRIDFINILFTHYSPAVINAYSWDLLDDIFNSVEVYIESDNDVQICLEAIIVHNVLNKLEIPNIVATKLKFTTLKSIKSKLSDNEQEKVFEYFYSVLLAKCKELTLDDISEFPQIIVNVENIVDLLSEWEKDLLDYPQVLNMFKGMLKHNDDNHWSFGDKLKSLYNKNKKWRKYLFKESILLPHNEEIVMNILKHDVKLLCNNPSKVHALQHDSNININRFLVKLKVFWPQLSGEWLVAYNHKITQGCHDKNIIKSLCILLPRHDLLTFLSKYAPDSSEISWKDENTKFLLSKRIGQTMYHSGTHLPIEAILPYIRGDYLEYGLPSLMSIMSNISSHNTCECLVLLKTDHEKLHRISIGLLHKKLKFETLKEILTSSWKSGSAAMRVVLFKITFNLLSQEKNPSKINDLWLILESYIDTLTEQENKKVYTLLGRARKLPKSLQAKFCVKGYKFLKSLPIRFNVSSTLTNIAIYTAKVIDSIDPKFMEELLLEYIDTWRIRITELCPVFLYHMLDVLAAFILCTHSETEQMEQFDKFLRPLLEECLTYWNKRFHRELGYKRYFEETIWYFSRKVVDNWLFNDYVAPFKVFAAMRDLLASRLPVVETYYTLSICNISVLFIESYMEVRDQIPMAVEEHLSKPDYYVLKLRRGKRYEEVFAKISPVFARNCMKLMNEDMEKYAVSIQCLFRDALDEFLYNVDELDRESDFVLGADLLNQEGMHSVISGIKLLPATVDNQEKKKKLRKVRETLKEHPSDEVKIHYYRKFSFASEIEE